MQRATHERMMSPKNTRGIVISKEKLLQNCFKDTVSFTPKKRQNIVLGATEALMQGAGLSLQYCLVILTVSIVVMSTKNAVASDNTATKNARTSSSIPADYNWSGLYAGGHLGYAWGNSNWTTAQGVSGTLNLRQPINSFFESGSFLAGLQSGYNYMFPNRLVAGAEIDASFPSWPNLAGLSIGGAETFSLPPSSSVFSYSETVLSSGTVRGRIGYAPKNWLFYATGGFAWTYDRQELMQLPTETAVSSPLWRFGWTTGAGVEIPVLPNWTAKLEYLLTNFSQKSVFFPNTGQLFHSNFLVQELRLGLNYQFDNKLFPAAATTRALAIKDLDNINFHCQTTGVAQGYPTIRSPYVGINSLPRGGQVRGAGEFTFFAGIKLWQGAEFWFNPEIDEGYGLGNTHGIAGFPSAESYKLGSSTPYARAQRYFIRQTIDLGGESRNVDARINYFADSVTANNLVLTIGRFYIVDLFDTNIYANNQRNDFLNWSLVNAGTFDYAGDAWGTTYGVAAEWNQNRFTLRGGVFDLSVVPTGGGNNARGYGLDPTFDQYALVGEIEERHEVMGRPGALKVTAFLNRGRAGNFRDAIALSAAFGMDVSDALAVLRKYSGRPGISFNLTQQVTESVGVFARSGWADGNIEPWDFTDIDRTLAGGVSIAGNRWGRPQDTIGIAGVINGITNAHKAYFNAGGLGILIGDGKLPNPGFEKIVEAYYSYALSSSTQVSLDYQYVVNPGYNTNRGPVNIFGGRFHWQF